jgi:hypothetical protein
MPTMVSLCGRTLSSRPGLGSFATLVVKGLDIGTFDGGEGKGGKSCGTPSRRRWLVDQVDPTRAVPSDRQTLARPTKRERVSPLQGMIDHGKPVQPPHGMQSPCSCRLPRHTRTAESHAPAEISRAPWHRRRANRRRTSAVYDRHPYRLMSLTRYISASGP